jgi:hypothetical protein
MIADSFVYLALFVAAYFILLGLHKRREGIRHSLRRFIIVGVSYLGVVAYFVQSGRWPPAASVAAGVIAALAVDSFIPRRTRYISKAERRETIQRFEKQTGERYDPRKHDIGHIVAFSRGGSSTADNLKVESRRENRSKGAKSPWWDLIGRIR